MEAPSKDEYLDWVKVHIEHDQGCPAYFLHTEAVHEQVDGNTVWLGDVEVFGLIGHSEAKRCFAWGHSYEGNDPNGKVVVALEMLSTVSAQTAVRAQLAKDLNSARSQLASSRVC